MKFSGFITIVAAALATAETQVSRTESDAWYSCTNKLLDEYSQGIKGDGPSCDIWDCLHEKAATYSRGGGITLVSNLLTPACVVDKFNPLNWFGGNPGGRYIPVSHDERRDWTDCTRSLLHDFDQGSEGNRAACDMWVCLHNQASKYHRGGILTTASNLLTPFCTAAGVILPN